jgi:hypothetical protein
VTGKFPTYTAILCSVCGRVLGKNKGVQVVTNVVCQDPFCIAQSVPTLNEARDSAIVFAAMEGIPASQIAFATHMSRQRVYQILDSWRQT